ncbi:MAG: PrsW family glutamic-type intramembrane protease [Haloarculaceae archaeon]
MDDGSRDLYDVATWERRTPLDRAAVAIYRLLGLTFRATVVIVAFLVLLGIGGLSALTDPQVGTLTVLSVVPAFGLALYVYYSDTTSGEPLAALVATFLLGILTANFAAVVNTLLGPLFDPFGFLGMALVFFLAVGPVEETVKLLAVRLYAYDRPTFDCVIDGAVYGAMAGHGFATVENALFITRQVGDLGMGVGVVELVGGGITAVRALAGPDPVIYSAVAGYYLGLANFNPENRGPILFKGLLIAAFIHATYNTTVRSPGLIPDGDGHSVSEKNGSVERSDGGAVTSETPTRTTKLTTSPGTTGSPTRAATAEGTTPVSSVPTCHTTTVQNPATIDPIPPAVVARRQCIPSRTGTNSIEPWSERFNSVMSVIRPPNSSL